MKRFIPIIVIGILISLTKCDFDKIGKTQKEYMEIKNQFKVSVSDIRKLHKSWFNNYFKESA